MDSHEEKMLQLYTILQGHGYSDQEIVRLLETGMCVCHQRCPVIDSKTLRPIAQGCLLVFLGGN